MFKKGEIIFREGERLEKAMIILEGEVLLTSTLGYEIKVGKGEIIGEWVLVGESEESATAVTNVEVSEIEEVGFTWGLLQRAFERLELVNKGMTDELKSPSEVLRIINRKKRGMWKPFSEHLRSPYYSARKMMMGGDYEGAFREFLKIEKWTTDQDIIMDSEVWKTYCMYFIDRENAMRRYSALVRKASDYRKYVSFAALNELMNKGEDKMDTTVKLYVKHGMLIPGRTIFMVEGETGKEAYFILTGYPRVARYSSGEEKILSFLGPAEFVGEMSTLGDRPRSATVLTGTMIQVLGFTASTLEGILNENKKFGLQLLVSVLRRIRKMRKLKEAGRDPLSRLKALFEGRKLEEVNAMKISLDELASYLDMDKSAALEMLLSKRMASLKSDGTVQFTEVP